MFSQYAINLNLEPPQETRFEATLDHRVASCVDGAARPALPPQVYIGTERARAYLISQGFAEVSSLCAVSQVYASASIVLALPTRSERLTSQAAVAVKAVTDGARCCERTNGR